MKLSDLIQRIKLQVPNMNQTGVSDTYLTTLLNQACNSVNLITKIYSTYTDFNIVADQREYSLSTNVPLYLGTDKRGLFFKDSDGNWQDIIPRTKAWISERYPDFLNSTSTAIPQWYWIDGDTLSFEAPPSTAYTNGARLYHLRKCGEMSSGDDYPFTGDTTEITAFIPLDDALIAYCRWKISPAFGTVTDQDMRELEFVKECQKGATQIKRSRDLTNDSAYRMQL